MATTLPVIQNCGDCAHGKIRLREAALSTWDNVPGYCHKVQPSVDINLVATPPEWCPMRVPV